MVLSISTRALELRDGGFKPDFCITEWYGDKATVTNYFIDTVCKTKEEAEKVAKYHAVQEIKKKYGNDAKVILTQSEPDKNIKP